MDPVLAEAHWRMRQVENHARYLRMVGNRTVEDLDIDEADFQQLLDELTDANNNLVQHNEYLPRHWVLGTFPRVPGHVLEDNSNLPLLELGCRFRKQAKYRHKCRMAAIEVEANAKIWKSLIGRSRSMRGG